MPANRRPLSAGCRRISAALGAAALALCLAVCTPAQMAQAHGAPWDPISRGAACSPDNTAYVGIAACDAAIMAGPPGALNNWDDERLHNVFGHDERFVPDGKLCSAGMPNFRGLDLVRSDWPSTVVTPGMPFNFQYRATIPHKGSFELYLTKQGYDPTKPLTWDELDSDPLAVVLDPPIQNAAYHFTITWPTNRTGPQVLYTIWRNTELADTYYSCSDLYFLSQETGAAAAPPPLPSSTSHQLVVAQHKKSSALPTIRLNVTPVGNSNTGSSDLLAAYAGGAVLAVTAVTLLVLILFLRRHSRS